MPSFTSLHETDALIDSQLASVFPFKSLKEYRTKHEEFRDVTPHLIKTQQIPIGQKFRDSAHPQLITVPYTRRKTFVVVGSPGSGKTVLAKTIVFDFLHKLFNYHLAVLSPKIEYTTNLMKSNTKWRSQLAKLGLPTLSHRLQTYTPSFAQSIEGVPFKFDLSDFSILGDDEWDAALYDIVGDTSPAGKSIIEIIKTQERPTSLQQLENMVQYLFTVRDKSNIESYFNPQTLRSVFSRLRGARKYLGRDSDAPPLNFPKLMTDSPVVFQSSTKQRNEFVNLYAGLFIEMIRANRTDYVNASRQNASMTNLHLTRPVIISTEEARFFAPVGRERSLSKQQLIDGVKTDRDVGISYCFVEQDLSLLDDMILNNADFFIYKGVPSQENILCIKRAFSHLTKEQIDDWVSHCHTASTDRGESPLKTTTSLISKRGIQVGSSIPSLCSVVEEFAQ